MASHVRAGARSGLRARGARRLPADDRRGEHPHRRAAPPPARRSATAWRPPTRCSRSWRERRLQMAGTLSGGQQKMLALARGLALRPKLLLVDEPTEGLMPANVELITARARSRRPRLGVAVLVVDASFDLITETCSRLYAMDRGVLIGTFRPGEFASPDELAARYLGAVSALMDEPDHPAAAERPGRRLVARPGRRRGWRCCSACCTSSTSPRATSSCSAPTPSGSCCGPPNNYVLSVVVGTLIVAVLGGLLLSLVVWPLLQRSQVLTLLATLGLSLILQQVATNVLGGDAKLVEPPLAAAGRRSGPVSYPLYFLVVVVVGMGVLVAGLVRAEVHQVRHLAAGRGPEPPDGRGARRAGAARLRPGLRRLRRAGGAGRRPAGAAHRGLPDRRRRRDPVRLHRRRRRRHGQPARRRARRDPGRRGAVARVAGRSSRRWCRSRCSRW